MAVPENRFTSSPSNSRPRPKPLDFPIARAIGAAGRESDLPRTADLDGRTRGLERREPSAHGRRSSLPRSANRGRGSRAALPACLCSTGERRASPCRPVIGSKRTARRCAIVERNPALHVAVSAVDDEVVASVVVAAAGDLQAEVHERFARDAGALRAAARDRHRRAPCRGPPVQPACRPHRADRTGTASRSVRSRARRSFKLGVPGDILRPAP